MNHTPIWKRTIDVTGAAVGLIALCPLMLIIAVLSRLLIGRPILFRQERPGLEGKSFTLLKFRTMAVQHDRLEKPLADERRLSSWGKFLRSTSLDELPELWNVLRGDMSLVGPRPLLTSYLKLYTSEQMIRHKVRPGLTGLAQISGRNALSWEEKFECDVQYVRNKSLLLDLNILWRTLFSVLKRDGITAVGHATMPPFSGSALPLESTTRDAA